MLGSELCQSYVVAEIVSLSDDDVFRVRKVKVPSNLSSISNLKKYLQTVAAHLPTICKVVGPDITMSRLMKVFVRLARDDIWGVRKSVTENIVRMAESLPLDLRHPTLSTHFEAFLSDVC